MYKNKKSGIWYADFLFEGRRYGKTLNVTSKSAAKELEDKFKTEVRSGKYAKVQLQKKQRILFSAAMKDYLEKTETGHKTNRSFKTIAGRGNHLCAYFGAMLLQQIGPDDVSAYKTKREAEIRKRCEKLKHAVSFASINREMALLRRLFNWYRTQKRVKLDNPVTGIGFYKEVARTRVLTEDEEKRFFMDGGAPEHVQNVVTIALSTGMRLNEILTLEKKDVLLCDIGGTVTLRDTKNGESRKIPLTNDLTGMFKRIIDNSLEASPYVFASPRTGKPMLDIKTSFVKSCKRAKIDNLHFHDLRHTFCTRLANEGVNPFIIMQIAGHKDTKTAQRYCNPTSEHLMAAMAKIEKKSHAFSQTAQEAQNLDEIKDQKSQVNIAV